MVGMNLETRAVQVKTADGSVVEVGISNLSAPDVAYAAARWKRLQAEGKGSAGPVVATSLVNLPPRYIARCSPASRLQTLAQNGGNPECEKAVSSSLEWLKGMQNADGSWGKTNKTAMTGFALQCYSGRCETTASAAYGDTVTRGLLFLVETAKSNPHGMLSTDVESSASTYAHAIATCGLGEAVVLASAGGPAVPGLRETFEKAVDLILQNQNKRGSWNYGGFNKGFPTSYDPGAPGEDLSLANWHLQALFTAREAGCKLAGLEPCIRKALAYLEQKQTKDGGFGALNRDQHYNQWSLTGGALLGMQLLSPPGSFNAREAKAVKFLRDYLTAEPMKWDRTCNLYSWFGNTQAFFIAGGKDWEFYVKAWLPEVLAAQQPDGSFKMGRADWSAAHAADPIYRQTLATLQLQVFYRQAR